jgi:hypothetical protein
VDRSVTPSFVEETTGLVEVFEVVSVGLRPQEAKTADFKVAPEMAKVIGVSFIVREEAHVVALGDVLRELGHKLSDGLPESWDGFLVLVEGEGEAVFLLVVLHVEERIVVDIAEELDIRLNTPVVFVILEEFVFEEKAGFEAAHVAVGDGVTVDDFTLSHILADGGGFVLIDPFWEAPVFLWNETVLGLSGNETGGDLLELIIEGLVVEENPIVVVFAIEAVLDVANGLGEFPGVTVSG